MATDNVVEFERPEPAIAEEAKASARIVLAIRTGAKGATAAEAELVARYSRGLRYLLTRRIGDDERARDLLQETLCIAIEKLRSTDIGQPERLAGYLRGIAVRVAFNAGRKRQREPMPTDIDAVVSLPDKEPRPFQSISQQQNDAAVRRLLESVPVQRDRELLTRFYIYDQDKEEICRTLELNSLHFNRVLFRAKGRFRKIIENSMNA
jgi:RNA polymerase sigma-70 factor (ECF subfamily)